MIGDQRGFVTSVVKRLKCSETWAQAYSLYTCTSNQQIPLTARKVRGFLWTGHHDCPLSGITVLLRRTDMDNPNSFVTDNVRGFISPNNDARIKQQKPVKDCCLITVNLDQNGKLT